MFGNGVCNEECNYSLCSYDDYECVENDESAFSFNLSKIFGNNQTYCNIEIINNVSVQSPHNIYNNSLLCQINWINDGWCDNNCRMSESCFYDANDCNCDQDTQCGVIYSFFAVFRDTTITDGTYVTKEGFCAL